MIIHLVNNCSIFDFTNKIEVKSYEIDSKSKGNAIIIQHKGRSFTIPWSNIQVIEE